MAEVGRLLRPGELFHERYRVVAFVAAGTMGEVYEVLDARTQGRRALKLMKAGVVDDPDKRARFAREATLTGGIESDHIVRAFDAGIDAPSGLPFLAMELLQGEDLGALAARCGALPAAEVVGYLSQAARALDKTHAAGIVHRDIKPANLFVARRDDGSPCVKILDFGIAKVVAGERAAQKTKSLGTPFFMAPEQMRGAGDIGPRADVYALGQVAYALLAGEPYWKEESLADASLYLMLKLILDGAKEPPSTRAARRMGLRLPPALDAWFFACTAPSPAARFSSAGEAIAGLERALALEPVGAPITAAVRSLGAPSTPAPEPAAAPRLTSVMPLMPAPLASAAPAAPIAAPTPSNLPVLVVSPAPVPARSRTFALSAAALALVAGVAFAVVFATRNQATPDSVRNTAVATTGAASTALVPPTPSTSATTTSAPATAPTPAPSPSATLTAPAPVPVGRELGIAAAKLATELGHPLELTRVQCFIDHIRFDVRDPQQRDRLDTYVWRNGVFGKPEPQPNEPAAELDASQFKLAGIDLGLAERLARESRDRDPEADGVFIQLFRLVWGDTGPIVWQTTFTGGRHRDERFTLEGKLIPRE